MADIKIYGKLINVTTDGIIADYDQLDGLPIVKTDLSANGFTPTTNTYYLHTSDTTNAYTNGKIYFYDGTTFNAIDGSGSRTGTATIIDIGSVEAGDYVEETLISPNGITGVTIQVKLPKLTKDRFAQIWQELSKGSDFLLKWTDHIFNEYPIRYIKVVESNIFNNSQYPERCYNLYLQGRFEEGDFTLRYSTDVNYNSPTIIEYWRNLTNIDKQSLVELADTVRHEYKDGDNILNSKINGLETGLRNINTEIHKVHNHLPNTIVCSTESIEFKIGNEIIKIAKLDNQKVIDVYSTFTLQQPTSLYNIMQVKNDNDDYVNGTYGQVISATFYQANHYEIVALSVYKNITYKITYQSIGDYSISGLVSPTVEVLSSGSSGSSTSVRMFEPDDYVYDQWYDYQMGILSRDTVEGIYSSFNVDKIPVVIKNAVRYQYTPYLTAYAQVVDVSYNSNSDCYYILCNCMLDSLRFVSATLRKNKDTVNLEMHSYIEFGNSYGYHAKLANDGLTFYHDIKNTVYKYDGISYVNADGYNKQLTFPYIGTVENETVSIMYAPQSEPNIDNITACKAMLAVDSSGSPSWENIKESEYVEKIYVNGSAAFGDRNVIPPKLKYAEFNKVLSFYQDGVGGFAYHTPLLACPFGYYSDNIEHGCYYGQILKISSDKKEIHVCWMTADDNMPIYCVYKEPTNTSSLSIPQITHIVPKVISALNSDFSIKKEYAGEIYNLLIKNSPVALTYYDNSDNIKSLTMNISGSKYDGGNENITFFGICTDSANGVPKMYKYFYTYTGVDLTEDITPTIISLGGSSGSSSEPIYIDITKTSIGYKFNNSSAVDQIVNSKNPSTYILRETTTNSGTNYYSYYNVLGVTSNRKIYAVGGTGDDNLLVYDPDTGYFRDALQKHTYVTDQCLTEEVNINVVSKIIEAVTLKDKTAFLTGDLFNFRQVLSAHNPNGVTAENMDSGWLIVMDESGRLLKYDLANPTAEVVISEGAKTYYKHSFYCNYSNVGKGGSEIKNNNGTLRFSIISSDDTAYTMEQLVNNYKIMNSVCYISHIGTDLPEFGYITSIYYDADGGQAYIGSPSGYVVDTGSYSFILSTGEMDYEDSVTEL